MTISSTDRKAGPFIGNDGTTDFPFTFKVFSTADLYVVRTDSAGAETELILTTDFTVTLNADQDENPGGTLILPVALATGYTLTIASDIAALQPVDLTNGGGFYPTVINTAFDRMTMLIQQIAESVSRSIKFSISTPSGVNPQLPTPVPYSMIGWNAMGDGFENIDPSFSSGLGLRLAASTGSTMIGDDDGASGAKWTTVGGFIAYLVSSAGAGVVGFIQEGVGAIRRTLQAKMREVSVSITDYNGSPTATGAVNSAAISAAATALYLRGGGFLDIPAGEFTFDCTDPAALSWNNRFCFRFTGNNVIIRGAGVGATILKQAAAQNAHVIQLGQRTSGIITVANCGVMDLTIDGNRANQTLIPNATDDHQQGVDVSSGCTGVKLHRLHIKNCMYYGVGFQSDDFQDCSVENVLIEDVGADGLDWKDTTGLNSGNVINGLVVRRFGLVAALPQQGGLNIRGGVSASNVFITEYDADRHGVRFDPTVSTATPSRLTNWFCKPSAVGTTVGVYINIPTGTDINDAIISNGDVLGALYGVDARWRFAKISDVTAKDCSTGFRVYQDNQVSNVTARSCTVAGYKVTGPTNLFTNASAYSCLLGADIDAASTQSSFRGGVFGGNTTNVTDAGTQTAISHVAGINTHGVGTASVAIDSTGEKTITIAHGLSFAPDLKNVRLGLQRDTVVVDFDIAPPYVYLADASNVYAKVLVKTASATVGAVITLHADCVTKKAPSQ